MKPEDITEKWLIRANERYRARDLHPMGRPFEAIKDLSIERNCSIVLQSPAAQRIFDWFKAHSNPEAHRIGAMFTGAFYFDAYFWPVHILLGYGELQFNALVAMDSMPTTLKADLERDSDSFRNYVLYWADCLDYGFGVEEILNARKLSEQAISFLENGDRELRSAIAQLLAHRPNSKAILSSRMTCEIFLKVLLIQEKGYRDKELKKLGHSISEIIHEAYQIKPCREFQVIEKLSLIFPDVAKRYDGDERPLSELWKALWVAQVATSTVVRHYSDRDTRPQIGNPTPNK